MSFKRTVTFFGNVRKIVQLSFRGLLEETLPQIFFDINIILGEVYNHDFWYGLLFGIFVVRNVSVAF